MRSRLRRQPGARAAVERHRIDVPFPGVRLCRRQQEPRLVRGQVHRRDLPAPARQLPRRGRRIGEIDDVEVHPSVALGEEPEAAIVREKARRAAVEGAATAHPRLVADVIDHARLAGLGFDRDQPAVLVVSGSDERDGMAAVARHRRHVPAQLARRVALLSSRLLVGDSRRAHRPPGANVSIARPGLGRRRGLGGSASEVERRPDRLLRGQVQDREPPEVLRIAHLRPRGNLLGVGARRHVGRNVGATRVLRPLDDQGVRERVLVRELQVRRSLALGQVEPGQRLLLAPALRQLAARLGLPHELEQRLLLGLQERLALSRRRILLRRSGIGHLLQAIARLAERHEVQAVLAREGDVRLSFGPARIALDRRGAGDHGSRAAHRVEEHDVAVLHRERAAALAIPDSRGRRSRFPLLVGQLARRARRGRGGRARRGRQSRHNPGSRPRSRSRRHRAHATRSTGGPSRRTSAARWGGSPRSSDRA